MEEVVIVGAARTPIGSFMGALSGVGATQLGAIAIKAALDRATLTAEKLSSLSENGRSPIDEVYMGMVLPAGVGQAPARQAAIFAGLGNSVPSTTINKVCGSGMKTIMLAAAQIALGDADLIVAGGMENMSQSPHALLNSRNGAKMGHAELKDLMVHDGLWDVYNNYHMGMAAELCAEKYGITRADQDEFAIQSYKKTLASQEAGLFQKEIIPVEIVQKKGDAIIIKEDEEPKRVSFDKITSLRPAFKKDGTVTAANASSINDGAAAVVLASRSKAEKLGLPILATIKGASSFAHAPEWFTTAPAFAIEKLLAKINKTPDQIELYEINEAFSVVSLAVNKLAKLPADRVNVKGGAVALGHPIGASGSRIVATLLYAMQEKNAKNGLASLCIGGGEAVALYIER